MAQNKEYIQLNPSNYYLLEVKELLLAKSYFDGAQILFQETERKDNQSKTFSNPIYPCMFLLHQALELSLKAHLEVVTQQVKSLPSDISTDTQMDRSIYKSHSLCKVLESIKEITQNSKNHDHKRLFEYEELFEWFDKKTIFTFRYIRDNNGQENEFHGRTQKISIDIINRVSKVISLLENGYLEFNFHKQDLGFFDEKEKVLIQECLSLLKNIYDRFTKRLLLKESKPVVTLGDLNYESNPLEENFRAYLSQQNIEDLRKALAGYYFLRGDNSCSQLLNQLSSSTTIQGDLEDKLHSINIKQLESILAEISF